MYRGINPEIAYRPTKFSRRCLTSPNVPRHNEGRDNENYDLILKVGDVLTSEPEFLFISLFLLSLHSLLIFFRFALFYHNILNIDYALFFSFHSFIRYI